MYAFRQQDRHTYSNSHLASVCDVTHLPDTVTEYKESQYSHFGYKEGRIDYETCMYVGHPHLNPKSANIRRRST
jgi:hypothetical protein